MNTLIKSPATSFRDLIVWQRAHELVVEIYRCTSLFPKTETYGLTSQFRRAGVSVPANIAEGFSRRTRPDKVRFMNIAQGSLEECKYYCILSRDLGYGEMQHIIERSEVVSKLLVAYMHAIVSNRSTR